MSKFAFYIVSFLVALIFITSCTSLFGWEKTSKTSTKFTNRIPSKLRVWERASRDSAKLAPLPKETKEAIVQIYAAPLWGLRGLVL